MSFPLRLSRRAFTLVELLVVIVILGILIAIAVPSFIGTRVKAQDSQAQAAVTIAAHNAKAVWVDEESYQDRDYLGAKLRYSEPDLAFKTTSTFSGQGPKTVFIDVTDEGYTVVLCAESNSGTWFCLTENAEGVLLAAATGAVDEPQLAATASLAKSWGPTLPDAICHLPTASATGGVGCAGGGPGWAKESGDDSEAEAESEGVPEITFVSLPPTETDQTTANFDWTITNSPTTVQCKIDAGSFTSCSAPLALENVSPGEHTLVVRAINDFGVGPTAEHTWTVSAEVPVLTIEVVTGPPATTLTTTAAFDYTTSDPTADFKCKLDAGSFTFCPFAVTYTGLSVGAHTFVMQATNDSGTVTSNTWNWTVLPPAPTVTITGTPVNHTTSTSANFTWTTTGTVSSTECKIDAGSYASCSSPHNLTGLSVGSHTFSVKVSNAGGEDVKPHTWTIDALPAPTVTLTGGPSEGSSSAVDTGSFSWTSTDATTTTCSLDGAAFTTCTSPYGYGPLSAGSHTFQVKVTNATAPSGVTTPLRTWTVQETYSQTVIASGASHYFRLNEAGPSCSTAASTVGGASGTYYGAFIGSTTFTCGESSSGPLTGTTGASNKFITKTSSGAGATNGGDKINSGARGTGLFFPDSAAWAGNTGTIEVWFKTGDTSSGSHFVYDKFGATAAFFDSGTLNVYSYGSAVSRNFSGLANNAWHHLVVATNGANIRIVIDGVQQVDNATNGTPNNTKSATFGYRGVGGDGNSTTPGNVNDQGYFFSGLLDEIAFYPTMLSTADVQAHYDARTR